jgi:HD-GYP domain-containing protein (c-di-GMP phosphodiesterase class II)
MTGYVTVPTERLQLGRSLPVDIRAPDGRLLMRRGQALESEAQRQMLETHHACMTETDAQAWDKALQRQTQGMVARGEDVRSVMRAPMPAAILDTDYLEGRPVDGGWLDVQEILRGLLYQGADASSPLPRLEGIEQAVNRLLIHDPDEALFVLFQALPDLGMGYCATHALLSSVVGSLTASKLGLPTAQADLLLRSALVMNIGMARPQDNLARQRKPPDAFQRRLINNHAPDSAHILQGFGASDEQWLAMVRHHHDPGASDSHAAEPAPLQLLSLADVLVAKMAPRTSRAALSSLQAVRSLMQDPAAQTQSNRAAMASVLGFYPPGTYVALSNGESAVVIARGERANTPHVASLVNAQGMVMSTYLYRDTRQSDFALRTPLLASQINIRVSLEKVRRLRLVHGV